MPLDLLRLPTVAIASAAFFLTTARLFAVTVSTNFAGRRMVGQVLTVIVQNGVERRRLGTATATTRRKRRRGSRR